MTKTITRTRRAKFTNNRIAHDVERIIKKAMTQTATPVLTKKIQGLVVNSLENAREKTETMQKGVAKYTHRKPLRSLGLAMLTGAVLGVVLTKSIGNNVRRYRYFR